MKALVLITIILSLCGVIFAAYNMTVSEVIDLYKKGAGVDVIVATIEARDAEFVLTSDDIIKLREEGIPENLIVFMISRKSKSAPVEDDMSKFLPKIGTVNIACRGDFSDSHKSMDFYIYACIALDESIKARKTSWDKINVLTIGGREVYSFKASWDTSFSLPVEPGSHEVSIYLYVGESVMNDYSIKSHKIYNKVLDVSEGDVINLNLVIEKKESGGYTVKGG
ncbi:MAG TPA: hypothetical protein ENI43_05450 [Firmicutes bacterium]|nr:hypothetical protein [Bacillota bacterium]